VAQQLELQSQILGNVVRGSVVIALRKQRLVILGMLGRCIGRLLSRWRCGVGDMRAYREEKCEDGGLCDLGEQPSGEFSHEHCIFQKPRRNGLTGSVVPF
jgi:hypothetical protein